MLNQLVCIWTSCWQLLRGHTWSVTLIMSCNPSSLSTTHLHGSVLPCVGAQLAASSNCSIVSLQLCCHAHVCNMSRGHWSAFAEFGDTWWTCYNWNQTHQSRTHTACQWLWAYLHSTLLHNIQDCSCNMTIFTEITCNGHRAVTLYVSHMPYIHNCRRKSLYLSTSLPVKSLGKTDRRLLMSCSTWSAFAAVCLGTRGDSVTSCCLAYRELAS